MKSTSLAAKLFFLLLVPLAGLTFFGVRSSLEKWRVYRDYLVLEQNSAVLQQIGTTVHELQKERGRSAGFLATKGAQFSTELRAQRTSTDTAVTTLNGLLRSFDAACFGAAFEEKLRHATSGIADLPARRDGISALAVSASDSTAYYTSTIASLLNVVVAMSHLSRDATIGNGISCYVNFLQAKEQAGIERATLTGVFAADAFAGESFRRFSQVVARQDTFLRVFESFASEEQRRFHAATVSGAPVEAVARMRQVAEEKAGTGGFGISSDAWFDASTIRLNLMKQVEDRLASDYATSADQIKRDARRDFIALALVTAAVIGLTLAVSWWIVRVITRNLLTVASTLADGAEQLRGSASQVSASSQTMAAGASEQAASLEETSSSLEEIASMTRRNAEAAGQAKALAGQTRAAADSGSTEMVVMQRAMDDIKGAASGIAKIVKSIDEIAFQTNILALNAAVEAARAGEAGAGFAVVADEVRALAQRSASAAKETAEQIEASVAKSAHGVEISEKVAVHFSEIVEKARQMDTLVAEIATASTEQTQGIEQVNVAVSQMDTVTQANAATAEESAAGAEALSSQSEELTAVVGQMLDLVGGVRANDARGRPGLPKVGGVRPVDSPEFAKSHTKAVAAIRPIASHRRPNAPARASAVPTTAAGAEANAFS